MKTSTIKPGVLVSLKTSLSGGAQYKRVDLEPDHGTTSGGRLARWETVREIMDATEYDNAIAARSLARAAIIKHCCQSSFGLLCPNENEVRLMEGIADAQRIAADFNASSRTVSIEVYTLVGRVASDDAEAARAIGTEVRSLLEAMQDGISKADAEAVREAANKARMIAGMLSDGVQSKVTDAISEARKAARDIVKRIEKAGESAAVVVAECKMEALNAARFAVLDLEQSQPVESMPVDGRAVDLDFTATDAVQS